ncbi:hypothetical protein FRC10_007488 [Ceratobasidium sp. 414]|nr:hypothetical protein FRC10_007488 [Ceratobasidium sp. 414]
MQAALKLRATTCTLPRSVIYARSCQPYLQLRAFHQTYLTRNTADQEKRLEEQRKIDEQKEKDKKRVYGEHYQGKEGIETPEIAATDESVSRSWDEKAKRQDVGHATIGPGHGRHQARTLASFSMEGKVCVVTGAARGLGNLFARTFVESGCTSIVLMDLKQEDAQRAADDLVKWSVVHGDIEPGAVTAIGIGCDVANEDSVKAGFDIVVKRFGKIDALVASAGAFYLTLYGLILMWMTVGIVENYSAFEQVFEAAE